MIIWHTLPDHIPFDGQHCWVRVKYYYSEPFEAYYSVAAQEWTSVDGGIVYPAWSVARWAAWYPPAPVTLLFQSDQTPLNTLTITLRGTAGYACVITWGDTTETSFSFTGSDQVVTHVYSSTGTYNVTLICFADVLLIFSVNNEPFAGSELPDFSVFTNLQELRLKASLPAPMWASLPFPFLELLNLANNGITGTFPSLINMPSLITLYCIGNSFTGSLPNPSPCPLLESYSFDDSDFTGSIPDWSSNTSLVQIRIAHLSLSGTLPSLSNLTALDELYATGCGISGIIPSLTLNVVLRSIKIDSNALSDYTPSVIALTLIQFWAAGNALPESAVNQILADFATNLDGRPSSGEITLDGGTNAAPTGQGLIDKAAIILHGWTCTTN